MRYSKHRYKQPRKSSLYGPRAYNLAYASLPDRKINDPGIFNASIMGISLVNVPGYLPESWFIVREKIRTRDGYNGRQQLSDIDIKLFGLFNGVPVWVCPYINKNGKLCVTPSIAYGWQDRQQVCSKPSKYLKMIPGITPEEVKERATQVNHLLTPPELSFATTKKEIERVYINGPNSCMSGPSSGFLAGGEHPCTVFGYDDDIAVAYLTKEGRITSRTLVNTRTKTWLRVYGDKPIKNKLKDLGYCQDDDTLDNCCLELIWVNEETDLFVLPYLDGHSDEVSIVDNHLVCSTNGDHLADNTCGLSYPGSKCCVCNEHSLEEEVLFGPNSEPFCIECFNLEYTYVKDKVVLIEDTAMTEDTKELFDTTDIPDNIQLIDDLYYGNADNYTWSEEEDDYILTKESRN